MKNIIFSRSYIIRAIQTICVALFFAASADQAHATPPFVQSGSTVVASGSGTFNSAFFQDPSSAYTVTVQPANGPTLTLNNASQVIFVGDGSAITINSGSTLNATGSGVAAVQINGDGTITLNDSQIFSPTNGVVISGGGILINSGSIYAVNNVATPTSGNAGIILGAGSVTNSGLVFAYSNGVEIDGSGTLTNSGTIAGINNVGVTIAGQGTVTNSGTIGSNGNGVFIGNGGTVTNSSVTSSIIGGNNGVTIQGSGLVTNYGSIKGTGSNGVFLNAGTVINSGSASSIMGANNGVDISGNGSVTNAGAIYGLNNLSNPTGGNSGVVISGGGSMTNSGQVLGYSNGVELDGGGTISNTGTIVGIHNAGIILGNGSVTNSGEVSSDSNGVQINGNGSVTTSGTIIGINNVGVTIGGSGEVTNSGTIISGGNGVYINDGGTVTNSGINSGISGGNNGVTISGAGGLVTNDGSIKGTGSNGVFLTSGSVINSGSASSIIGANNGVDISGSGAVTNDGSIYGVNNVSNPTSGNGGVIISGGGSVTSSGLIEGHTNGVEIDGSGGSISNSGTINGLTNAGVTMSAGSVINSGAINGGGGNGVFLGAGAVINSGLISDASGNPAVFINGANSSLVSEGGEIASPTGASVGLGGANSSVTIEGRAQMVGQIQGNNHANNIFNLNLVGVTPEQLTELAALSGSGSGSITIGTSTYNWTGFTSSIITATSLEQNVDPGLLNAARAIDANGLTAYGSGGAAFDGFFAAALNNPEAAMNELVGREINQGLDTIGVNVATSFASDLDDHLDNLLTGGQEGGFDVGGLNIGQAGMYAFSDPSARLDSLINMRSVSDLGGTEMSTDSKAMVTTSQPNWGVWMSGNVTLGDESGANTLSGFHSTLGSPTLGFDLHVTPNLVIGVLANYTTGDADFNDGSRIGVKSEIGALYGTWRDGNWHVNGIVGAGATQFSDSRTTFGSTASSTPRGTNVITDWLGGYDFHLGGGWNITPEVGLQYAHLGIDSFTESGAGVLDLSEGSQEINSLRSHVGFHINKAYHLAKDLTFIPELRAQWYHEFLDDSRGVSTSLPGSPVTGSFSVNTFAPQRDFALVGAGLNTVFTGYNGVPVGLFVNYDAQVGQSDYIANSVNAGIRVDF